MTGGLIVSEGATDPVGSLAQDAALWGAEIPPEMLSEHHSDGVWPENAEAVCAYFAVCTQWRIIATADGKERAIGLDYPAVKVGLDMAGITATQDLWSDLQMIEIGARAAMNGETL